MKILGIEHIGIAVDDIKNDSTFWKEIMKIDHSSTEDIKDQGVLTDIYDTGKGKIELLEATGLKSPIAKFLRNHGQGVHHICFEVENIEEAIEELKEKKIELITEEAITGAEGYKIIFIHPRSAGGVLVELAEK